MFQAKNKAIKQSFKKKALKPLNGKTLGNQPSLHMMSFCTWKTLYAKLHILIIRSFIIMYYWGFCFAVWMHANKKPTPGFLRVERTQKLDGDMTQKFSVFVCFQDCTFSLIVSSQLLPCICIKGLHTSFHLPDNQKNNHFDCLEITKVPDTAFINPYPLPMIILFYEMNSWIPATTKILCASKTLAELFKMLFAEFCMKIMSKFLIFRILLTHS